MPQNLPLQILQRIVRLCADGNSQREVARMQGMSQGCISKILRHNRETGRPHQRKLGGSMKISMPRENRQLLQLFRTNRYIRLLVCECRWSTDLGSGCQFEPFRDGCWPPDIGLGVQTDVLGSVWAQATPLWGERVGHKVWDESRFSLYHSDGRVRVRRSQGEGLIDAYVQPNDGNRGPSVMVWGAIHQGGGVSWSWWMEPWTVIGIKCCHGRRVCLDIPLCTSKTMPRHIQHVTRQPFWTNRMLRSWTGQLGIQTWTQLSMFGIKY